MINYKLSFIESPSEIEINLNSYVIVPQWYTDKFQLKELKMGMKSINMHIKTTKKLRQFIQLSLIILITMKF